MVVSWGFNAGLVWHWKYIYIIGFNLNITGDKSESTIGFLGKWYSKNGNMCAFVSLSTRCSLLYFIWGYLGCWEQPWFVAQKNGGNMFGMNEISISNSCSYRWGACFLSGQPGNPIINLSFADGLCCIMPFISGDFDDGYCWVYHCTFRCSSSWLELPGDAQPCAPWAMGKPGEPHMARRELFPASC